jgi:hypothetical protein
MLVPAFPNISQLLRTTITFQPEAVRIDPQLIQLSIPTIQQQILGSAISSRTNLKDAALLVNLYNSAFLGHKLVVFQLISLAALQHISIHGSKGIIRMLTKTQHFMQHMRISSRLHRLIKRQHPCLLYRKISLKF